MDWIAHAKHRQEVVDSTGEWRGIADENGIPLMDLPPAIELRAPETRLSPESASFKLPIRSRRGVVHPLFQELVGNSFGVLDQEGRLALSNDKTRFVVVQRATGVRRTYKAVFSVLDDGVRMPSQIEVHATDMLRLLSGFPAMSAPTTWQPNWTRFTRDWVGPENTGVMFSEPRDLAGMQMVTVADGSTIEGPAEDTIRRLITESLAAAYRVAGIEDHPIRVVQQSTGRPSPHVLIRPTDKALWEEIAPIALAAGVRVNAAMWWPGDLQPPGMELDQPAVIVTVEQI